MSEAVSNPKRMRLDSSELEKLNKDEIIVRWLEQEQYIRFLEGKQKRSSDGGEDDVELKDKQQHIEAARRENTLVLRLTTKEQELQDYMNQIQELKQQQSPSASQLRTMLLDPAINAMFQRMAKEMDESKEKLKQTQNELSAWKFTPDSQTGKKLMVKCRMLLQENEELGKVIASGRTAKLEAEIALEKTLVQEMKKSQAELDEFLGEIDEDVEGMQTMIYALQQQVKEAKEQIRLLQEENGLLRQSRTSGESEGRNTATPVSETGEPVSVGDMEEVAEERTGEAWFGDQPRQSPDVRTSQSSPSGSYNRPLATMDAGGEEGHSDVENNHIVASTEEDEEDEEMETEEQSYHPLSARTEGSTEQANSKQMDRTNSHTTQDSTSYYESSEASNDGESPLSPAAEEGNFTGKPVLQDDSTVDSKLSSESGSNALHNGVNRANDD